MAKDFATTDMPIKGLTTNARFPVIGQLRKGAPRPDEGNRPGKDLTFFRFTSEEPGLEEVFRQQYGDEPRALDVYLPYPTADENFEAYLEEYVQSGLVRRCDGERLLLKREEDGEISTTERPCESGAALPPSEGGVGGGCACKATARLTVILPKLEHFSVVVVLTTSKHDIMNLYGALKRYEHVAGANGRDLSGIPFTLKRVPRKISTPARGGGRARRQKWLLSIEPSSAWVSVQLRAAQDRALLAGGPVANGNSIEIGGAAQALPAHATDGPSRTTRSVSPSAITGADPGVIRELQTASTDFGFTSKMRELRLAFGSLVAGRDLHSFSEATNDEATLIEEVLLAVIGDQTDKAVRLAFAAFAVRCGFSLSAREDLHQALSAFAEGRFEAAD